MELKAREGDLIETVDRLIFDVKGLIHPPERIVAYLRYYPDLNGRRSRKGIRYEKIYSLDARQTFLENKYPQYLFYDRMVGETLQGVVKENVKKIYHPTELVRDLSRLDEKILQKKVSSPLRNAFELVKLIQSRTGLTDDAIGITGSPLVGLETQQSDIDLMIYGSKNAYRVKDALSALHLDHAKMIQPYNRGTISKLYEFRGKNSGISFEKFVKIEQRKKLQGIFKKTDYYIRCIKDWKEIQEKYGDIEYRNIGIATINSVVSEASESILTPCKYLIESSEIMNGVKLSAPIREIVSYRGRFCEQAQEGEEIEARGKVESVIYDDKKYYRLLLGTYKGDYMKLLKI